MLEILFLGTGASIPSKDRSLPAVAVRSGRDIFLFDCGEGTQRQLMISPYSFMKIKVICITHLHGDHFLGLPGLLLTMGMSGRKDKLIVAGPEGISDILNRILRACGDELTFPLEIMEVTDGDFFDIAEVGISVFNTKHTVPSIGFSLSEKDRVMVDSRKASDLGVKPEDIDKIRRGAVINGVTSKDISSGITKGLKVVYTGDTEISEDVRIASKDADVLIHEATFGPELEDIASEHGHATSIQTAEMAKDSEVRLLILTHVSNRYKDRTHLLEEASKVFPDTMMAEDFTHLSITKREIRLI